MKTAVIYARYSCDNQSEQSIEGQMTVCNKYAQDNGLVIVDTYIDRATTGTNDNRAAFQQMLADSKKASWEVVIVYAIDRFGRNSVEVALNKQKLKLNSKILVSATQRTSENIDGTKNLDGIILEGLYITLAEYYSEELSQKVKRGMKETRSKGYFQGGQLLYGYKLDGRKIVIDESEAETVRYLFTQYSKGVSVRVIIEQLHAMGIYCKGKRFLSNSVYNMLKNEKYSGVYKHGEEVIDNMYPQIVSTDLFQSVQAIIQSNKYGKGSVTAEYLLKHKLTCGCCGQAMHGESGTTKNGTKRYYYKCNGRKKRLNDCKKSAVRKEVLEQLVISNILEQLNQPETIKKAAEYLVELQKKQIAGSDKLQMLLNEKKQAEISLNNILAAIERGIISQTTNKRLHDLEVNIGDLEQQIAIEKAKTEIIVNEEEIIEYYTEAVKLEPQMLINYLVKEIKVYDDEVKIIYNNPTAISPDESQGFSFYTKTVEMLFNFYCNQYCDAFEPKRQKVKIQICV